MLTCFTLLTPAHPPPLSQSTSSRGATSPASRASASRPAPPPSSCKVSTKHQRSDVPTSHTKAAYHLAIYLPVQTSQFLPSASAPLRVHRHTPALHGSRSIPAISPDDALPECALFATADHPSHHERTRHKICTTCRPGTPPTPTQKLRSLAYAVGANLPLSSLMIHNGAAEMATITPTFQINGVDSTKFKSARHKTRARQSAPPPLS